MVEEYPQYHCAFAVRHLHGTESDALTIDVEVDQRAIRNPSLVDAGVPPASIEPKLSRQSLLRHQ